MESAAINKRDNIIYTYYALILIVTFFLCHPGQIIPLYERIGIAVALFVPTLIEKKCCLFALTAILYCNNVSFTPIAPESIYIYVIISIVIFFLYKNKASKTLYFIPLILVFLLLNLLNFEFQDYVSSILIVALLSSALQTKAEYKMIAMAIILSGILGSVLFIVHFDYYAIQYNAASDFERGGWINPNVFGCYIAIGVITSFSLLLKVINLATTKVERYICLISVVLGLFVLVINASRGAIISAGVAILLMMLFANIKKKYIFLVFVALVALVYYMYNSGYFALLEARMEDKNTGTAGGRTEIWQTKLNYFMGNINLKTLFIGYGRDEGLYVGAYSSTHNDLVTAIISYGLIGLISYLALFYVSFKRFLIKNRSAIAILVFLFLEAMVVEPFFRANIIYMLLWVMIYIYSVDKDCLENLSATDN